MRINPLRFPMVTSNSRLRFPRRELFPFPILQRPAVVLPADKFFGQGFIQRLISSKPDDLVKSRLSRGSGSPDIVPAKAGSQYLKRIMDSTHQVRGRLRFHGNDQREHFQTFYEAIEPATRKVISRPPLENLVIFCLSCQIFSATHRTQSGEILTLLWNKSFSVGKIRPHLFFTNGVYSNLQTLPPPGYHSG